MCRPEGDSLAERAATITQTPMLAAGPSPSAARDQVPAKRRHALSRLWLWYIERSVVTQAALVWLLTRLLLVVVTVASLYQRHQPLSHFFTTWVQWDAGWYIVIARAGYWSRPAAAFFPLYPLTMHVGSLLFHFLPQAPVAMIVSNLATLAAMIGVGLLARYEAGEPGAALPAIAVTLAYPLAFFLAAPYTEGLFLALTVFALYFARRGYWWRAALCAFLAGLTRSTGVILILPLLWEYGAQHKWWHLSAWRHGAWRVRLRPRVVARGLVVCAAVPAAFGVVMLIDWHVYGDPLRFLHAESLYWQHASWTPWHTATAVLSNILHPPASSYFRLLMVVNLVPLVGMLAATILLARRLTPIYVLYMLGLLYLIFSAPVANRPEVFVSAGRYLVVAFPLFLVIARWGEAHPRILATSVCAGLLLQVAFAYLFVRGVWVE